MESYLHLYTSLPNQHTPPVYKGLVQTHIKYTSETQLYSTAPIYFCGKAAASEFSVCEENLVHMAKKNLLISHIVFSRTKNNYR